MRKSLISLVLALSLSSLPAFSANTPKAGSACNKKGVTKSYKGKEFKCIKKGGKLVWSKGKVVNKETSVAAPEVIPTPIPTPTPTPTPNPATTSEPTLTPAPTPVPTPTTSEEVNSLSPTSFSNLIERWNLVPTTAWNEIQKKISGSPSVKVDTDFHVGPNTQIGILDIEDIFERGTKVFQGFSQPPSFYALFFNFSDLDWAVNKFKSLHSTDLTRPITNICLSEDRCNGATGGIINRHYQVNFGINSSSATSPIWTSGAVLLHEYTHMVQSAQFNNVTKSTSTTLLGCWFVEGEAQALGIASASESQNQYMYLRKSFDFSNGVRLSGLTKDEILNFYSTHMNGRCDSDNKGLAYHIGFITVESLISIGGVDKLNKFVDRVAQTGLFEESFHQIYELPWREAAEILAQVSVYLLQEN